MIFREIKRLMLLERKKERKKEKYLSKLNMKNFLLSLSFVQFVNDFDDSINFHSVNFH